jgi:tetratricopeptide (TPR) repeat protein
MNQINVGKQTFIVLFLFIISINIQAQTFSEKQITVQRVFDKLVNAYGNAKAAPKLILLPNTQKERVVAVYSNTPQPTIKVDELLFDICQKLKSDSLNALATIISHELAHYYNDHTFCSDYAFATKNKLLLHASKESKIEKETKADRDGLFYAMIAGYKPLQTFESVLNSIYKTYKLPATLPGYPSLSERIKMINYQIGEVKDLQAVYDAGLTLLYLDELPQAADCFNYLSMYFPSREVYNNLGVANFLQAVQRNSSDSLDLIYPIDIDPVSRLYGNNTRGSGNQNKSYKELLKDAKRFFEKAQSLDPKYFPSYINLACTNTALQNYDMALGNLNEAAELKNRNDEQILHLKAIINAKQNKIDDAFVVFEKIGKQDSLAAYNYRLLKTTLESHNSFIKIDSYKDGWIKNLQNQNIENFNCKQELVKNSFSKIIKVNEELTIKRNSSESISINLDEKNINAIISPGTKKETNGIQIINKTKGCIGLMNKTIAYEVEYK